MSTTPSSGPVPLPTAVPVQTADKPHIPLPEPPAAGAPQEGQKVTAPARKEEQPKQPKLFSLGAVVPTVTARVHLPHLYPDYEPWAFTFRTSFSSDMQRKRDAFLALPPSKQNETEEEEVLSECADLLAEDPTGFGDWPEGLMSPGDKLKEYYRRAKENPIAHPLVKSILIAANNIYWATIMPREFFPPSAGNSA